MVTKTIDGLLRHIMMKTVALAFFLSIIVNTLILKEPAPDLVTVSVAFTIFLGVTFFLKDWLRIGEYPTVFITGFLANTSYSFFMTFFKLSSVTFVWAEEIKTSVYFGLFTLTTYVILTRVVSWLKKR